MDPAGVGACGFALRYVATIPQTHVELNALRVPDWHECAKPFESDVLDRLGVELANGMPPTTRLLLCVEDSVYNSYTVARHIGRGIGAVELALIKMGWLEAVDTVWVTPCVWRKVIPGRFILHRDADGNRSRGRMTRAEWKVAAVEYCKWRYTESLPVDEAEAVCINDWFCEYGRNFWGGSAATELALELAKAH